MSTKLNSKINQCVKEAAERCGWDIWSTFSDKRKDGTRRLAYMRNGWRIQDNVKQEIVDCIKRYAALDKEISQHIISVDWIVSVRGGYGEYDKLTVVVKS